MKRVLILNTRSAFVDDIAEVLKEEGFDITLLSDCSSLASLGEAAARSDLCVVVTTFDERALHDDWHRLVLRQRFASDSVFSVGIVVGMMISGVSKSKFLLYKRDRIDSPYVFNAMRSVCSMPELRNYLDTEFASEQPESAGSKADAAKRKFVSVNTSKQGVYPEASLGTEKQPV